MCEPLELHVHPPPRDTPSVVPRRVHGPAWVHGMQAEQRELSGPGLVLRAVLGPLELDHATTHLHHCVRSAACSTRERFSSARVCRAGRACQRANFQDNTSFVFSSSLVQGSSTRGRTGVWAVACDMMELVSQDVSLGSQFVSC